jgi:hypothetical protein
VFDFVICAFFSAVHGFNYLQKTPFLVGLVPGTFSSWNTFTPENTEGVHRHWLHEKLTNTEEMNGKFILSYITR